MARISSFFLKIFSAFFLIILLLLILTLFTTFRVTKSNYINILKTQLKKVNLALTDQVVHHFEEGDIDQFVKEKGMQLNIRITIVDTMGVVLGDSEHNPEKMENHRRRDEIDYAFQNDSVGSSLRYSSTLKKEMLYVAQTLHRGDEVIGVIRTSMFLENINEIISDLRTKLMRTSYLVFFIALIVAIFMSRNFSTPVTKLKNAALRVSNGNLSTRVDINSKGDLKTFADSFNEMTSKIQTLFTRIESEKETLNCLLESIKEGICVLNSDGTIILANPEMVRITETALVGKNYAEIFRGKYFKRAIEKVLKNETVSMETIK